MYFKPSSNLYTLSLHSVKSRNRELIKTSHYNGMTEDPNFRNFRYLILRSDSSRLYRSLSKLQGIDTSRPPEVNVHEWLNPQSPSYNSLLHRSVIHYSARATKSERFEAIIVSKEMRKAAHKYAHHSQIILDGTFGVCDRRVLLFIAMGVDENNHGVPIAFFFFSAPAGNKHTAAGYNTNILTKLLQKWKNWMESGGQVFEPRVAITDTDTKERGALLAVFPNIILLLCKFHLRQCWTNKRRTLLNAASGSDFIKQQTKARLYSLEVG